MLPAQRFVSAVAAIALAAGLTGQPVAPKAAEPFYAGKTLTVIAGYRPGGGVDNNARLVGRHIGKFIPGNPKIINKNMPGAGGARLANYMYNKAKPDGLTIALPGRTWMFSKLFRDPGVRFQPVKFDYIGSPGPVHYFLWVRADLGIRSLDDLKKSKRRVVFGGLRKRASNVVIPRILQDEGWPIKALHGYKGTSKIMLAMEQKEVDGMYASESTLRNNRGDMIDNKFIVPLLQNMPITPNMPVITDHVSDKSKRLLQLVMAPSAFGVPAIAPPGTPKDRLEILRNAYLAMSKDPDFQADAKSRGIAVGRPVPGDELRGRISGIIASADQSVVDSYLHYAPPRKKKKKK